MALYHHPTHPGFSLPSSDLPRRPRAAGWLAGWSRFQPHAATRGEWEAAAWGREERGSCLILRPSFLLLIPFKICTFYFSSQLSMHFLCGICVPCEGRDSTFISFRLFVFTFNSYFIRLYIVSGADIHIYSPSLLKVRLLDI